MLKLQTEMMVIPMNKRFKDVKTQTWVLIFILKVIT